MSNFEEFVCLKFWNLRKLQGRGKKLIGGNPRVSWVRQVHHCRHPIIDNISLCRNLVGKSLELLEKSPCPHPLFGRAFSRYPLFQWCPQSKEILLNLSMKCWNSAFTAQGSRLIIVFCTGKSSENICRSSGGAQEIGKTDETQFTAKIAGKTSLRVSYFAL
jgi:hypothetical protein